METERIASLLEQLSPEQRRDYERLLSLLSEHGGDLTKLSAQDQETLANLSAAMNPQQDHTSTVVSSDEVADHTADVAQTDRDETLLKVPELSPTSTPFGLYVVEQLKILCDGGSSLADAVRYAYHNKYLPVALKDSNACNQIYQRYILEIDELTENLQAVKTVQAKEVQVLVGLAYFSILFQCYQYVEAYGDLH
ncbi:MAG: hypothetical protein HKP09_09210 [Enterobacterales bacterium]|nr:hypothetical protein [Enterobacterales bacterium]